MTRAPLRERRLSGVPSGSGLTGRRAGEPEPDDEDDPGSIRRGVQKLPRRRENDGCYVSNVSTFPNTFAFSLDSNLHDLNGTNPD